MTQHTGTRPELRVSDERAKELAGKATPGPWRRCGANDGRCRCGAIGSISQDRALFRIVPTHDEVADAPGKEWNDEDYANMDLAALAPDLLADRATLLAALEQRDRRIAALEEACREAMALVDRRGEGPRVTSVQLFSMLEAALAAEQKGAQQT